MQNKQTYTQNDKALPLITFIVPCYNLPVKLIKECLDSIFALSLSDDDREIILVDDGSDISPLNELLNYRDKIIYIRQKNKGLSGARNTALALASGQYVQFVDGDDTLVTTAYEHCLDLVRYKDADIVLFNLTTKQRKDDIDAGLDFEGPVSGTEYMRHNNLRAGAWGYIFRRSMLGSLRFHQGILHEDEEFTPQLMLRAENVYETKSAAYYYRQRRGSITHEKGRRWTLKRLNDTVKVLSVLRDRADVMPYNDRTALQRRIDQLTMDYLYNVITLTHSSLYLERVVKRLHEKGLFPLSEKDYTRKYKYFRRLVNSKVGRKILLTVLRK